MKEFVEFELIERLYFFELDRKQQLESNISLPTGAIVAAFGVLGYYFTHFGFAMQPYRHFALVEFGFILSAVVTCALLALATYWCFRAAVGSTYEYLPGAENLRSYFKDLADWHKKNSSKQFSAAKAKSDFEYYLIESMAKCAQRNWSTNLVRSEELHKTKRFTVLGLVTLAICAVTYYINFWFDPKIVAG
jgi:hypothetical protein